MTRPDYIARGVETRERILAALAGQPLGIAELSRVVRVAESSVRHHVYRLEKAGHVVTAPGFVNSSRGDRLGVLVRLARGVAPE